MRIRVGSVVKDRAGCTVTIIHKINDRPAPYVGIVDWSTAKDIGSRSAKKDVELYFKDGRADFLNCRDFDLVPKKKVK